MMEKSGARDVPASRRLQLLPRLLIGNNRVPHVQLELAAVEHFPGRVHRGVVFHRRFKAGHGGGVGRGIADLGGDHGGDVGAQQVVDELVGAVDIPCPPGDHQAVEPDEGAFLRINIPDLGVFLGGHVGFAAPHDADGHLLK